jgi:hypothetical protein
VYRARLLAAGKPKIDWDGPAAKETLVSGLIGAVDVALITGICAVFGTPLPTHWAAIAVALVLGAASFCALGVAVASLIRNSEAAPAVVQLVLFPLVFISGSYMPIHSDMLNRISGALPVRPFNLAPASRCRVKTPCPLWDQAQLPRPGDGLGAVARCRSGHREVLVRI